MFVSLNMELSSHSLQACFSCSASASFSSFFDNFRLFVIYSASAHFGLFCYTSAVLLLLSIFVFLQQTSAVQTHRSNSSAMKVFQLPSADIVQPLAFRDDDVPGCFCLTPGGASEKSCELQMAGLIFFPPEDGFTLKSTIEVLSAAAPLGCSPPFVCGFSSAVRRRERLQRG